MTKRVSSRFKINRRYGVDLWGSPKSSVHKRNYRPGEHGHKPKSKPSSYAIQLEAKQKLKGYYTYLKDSHMMRIFKEARRLKGDVAHTMISLLECQLGILIYRMKFVKSPSAARQFVNHGHVCVNGKRVNIARYSLNAGDVISLHPKTQSSSSLCSNVDTALSSDTRDTPPYLDVDPKAYKAVFLRTPSFNEVPYEIQIEPRHVKEWYSRRS